MFTFGWLTVTADDLAIWEKYPNAAFTLYGKAKAPEPGDEEEETVVDDDAVMVEGSSSTFKLKPWNKRKRQGMGYDPVVDTPKARQDAEPRWP